MALIAPSEQVSKILTRAGVQNFLQIYNSIEELKRASDEIIKQTSQINIGDIQAIKAGTEKPVSEFEDFRSEMGKAIETPESKQPSPEKDFQADSAFTSSTPEIQPFEQVTPTAEKRQQPEMPPPSPPQRTPQFTESAFSPAEPQNLFHQSIQPPPPPPTFDQSSFPSIPGFEAPQPQKPLPEFGQPPVMPPPSAQARGPGGEFVSPAAERKPRFRKDIKADRLTDEEQFEEDFDREKKKFPLAVVFIIIIAIIGISSAVYLVINLQKFFPRETKIEQKATEKPSQISVEEVTSVPDKVEAPETPTSTKSIEKKPVVPTKKTVISKPISPPSTKAPAIQNRIIITSSPSDAGVFANGKKLGKTPYTWNNPSIRGNILIAVDKNGYNTSKMNIEFNGGTYKKHFSLMKAASEVKPPPKTTVAEKPPSTTPVKTTAKPTTTKPVATTPKKEAEPVTTTPTATKKPEKPPVAEKPKGAPGTIFISSLPPMADVYMDGKKIGKTNIAELKITAGTHTMKFVKGPKELTKQMTFTAGKNLSQLIRLK